MACHYHGRAHKSAVRGRARLPRGGTGCPIRTYLILIPSRARTRSRSRSCTDATLPPPLPCASPGTTGTEARRVVARAWERRFGPHGAVDGATQRCCWCRPARLTVPRAAAVAGGGRGWVMGAWRAGTGCPGGLECARAGAEWPRDRGRV